MKQYLDKRKKDHSPALFTSLSHNPGEHRKTDNIGRLTTVSVEKLVRTYTKTAGIKKRITPHSFRHFFGTYLLTKNVNIKAVQDMLGHTSLNTTEIYLHLIPSVTQKSHEMAFESHKSLVVKEQGGGLYT